MAHLHNDYGLGTINAITAVSCGFKVVSVTANGYGERAGNVKLHEFVVALRVLYGVELPGFKYDKVRELARFMERMSGIPLQQHEPIVGSKVFAHESGIHTQAMLIDHRMYEAVPAELVGARRAGFSANIPAPRSSKTRYDVNASGSLAPAYSRRRTRASRHRRSETPARRASGIEQERRNDRALRSGDAPAIAQRRRRRRNRYRARNPR